MSRIVTYGAALAALTFAAASMPGPALAGRSQSRAMLGVTVCKEARSHDGAGCGPAAELVLDEFRGRAAAAAIRGLGAPERTRLLPGGARVLVWDRSAIEMAEGGRVIRREECQLLMAVDKNGIVSDATFNADAGSCSKRFIVRRQ
jgi:hypothetical protein